MVLESNPALYIYEMQKRMNPSHVLIDGRYFKITKELFLKTGYKTIALIPKITEENFIPYS